MAPVTAGDTLLGRAPAKLFINAVWVNGDSEVRERIASVAIANKNRVAQLLTVLVISLAR
jgi:hypothetical protein